MQQEILKQALANAIKFDGKANPGAVIGRIISQFKDKDPKDIAKEVNKIIKEVNSLPLEEQKKRLDELGGVIEVKKEKKEGLKELPFAEKGKVVMRMAPSPSGPMHIGHAYVASLNYEYAKKYDGKFIIRIEDTNPDNIYPPAYELIPRDANWLCENKVDQIIIQSDRLDIYYLYAEKLLKNNHLYVCDCDPLKYKDMISKAIACPCRDLSAQQQLKRFKDMFDKDKYPMGSVVVRFKSDIKHKNPAMRDFPLLRINDSEHPRTGKKYRVWPLMNFSVAIDDLELGVTHTLRGKDHADNAKRQEMIHKALKKPTPIAISVGRINFEGFPVSCSKTKEAIDKKQYTGWDDIRIPFLPALNRRGYQPEALRRYAVEVGVTRNDKSVTIQDFFKSINAFNKDIIDSISHRFFFVPDPKEITVENAPNQQLELNLHPDNKKGGRKFKTNDKFYIQKDDHRSFKEGELIRLMKCLNFIKKGNKLIFESTDYETFKSSGKTIIHWLPKEELVDVEVLMPDNKLIKGLAENNLKSVKVGHVIQFERFGFVRLDLIDGKTYKFWFAHR